MNDKVNSNNYSNCESTREVPKVEAVVKLMMCRDHEYDRDKELEREQICLKKKRESDVKAEDINIKSFSTYY